LRVLWYLLNTLLTQWQKTTLHRKEAHQCKRRLLSCSHDWFSWSTQGFVPEECGPDVHIEGHHQKIAYHAFLGVLGTPHTGIRRNHWQFGIEWYSYAIHATSHTHIASTRRRILTLIWGYASDEILIMYRFIKIILSTKFQLFSLIWIHIFRCHQGVLP
jgi:hypothetical protein